MIAQIYIDRGYPVYKVLPFCGLKRSTFYYKHKEDALKRGRKYSVNTLKSDGSSESNEQVIEDIKTTLGREFVDYGYLKMTHHLRQKLGYIINHKKVYNLMSQANLLQQTPRKSYGLRVWVKELVPQPTEFFTHLEFDIKYIWVNGDRRNAMVLTVIDVYSRWVLGQYISWQIDQYDVMRLFDKIFNLYPIPEKIFIRNDNGSQMEAKRVQEYFENKGVIQEFTKPATPEQNAHIESYHSIVERVICNRYDIDTLEELYSIMSRWITFYNTERIHSGIGNQSPLAYLRSKSYQNKFEYVSDWPQSQELNPRQLLI